MTTQYTAHVSDPIALALDSLAAADEWTEGARASSATADTLARSDRPGSIEARAITHECERAHRVAIKRAEVLAQIAQAQALDSIAESLNRIALAR